MEKENKDSNSRFYILLIILIILSLIISYFNYKMDIIIPNLHNATYENILKHTKIKKNIKKFT